MFSKPGDIEMTKHTLGADIERFHEEAEALLDELPRRGLYLNVITSTSIVSGFAENGNFEDAFLMWHCMSEYAVQPDAATCSVPLSGYYGQKRMDEAMFLFRKMLSAGFKQNLILFNTLIHGFSLMGDVDNAIQVVCMKVEYDAFPNENTLCALILGNGLRNVADSVGMATLKLRRI